jgi:hypothetical protein
MRKLIFCIVFSLFLAIFVKEAYAGLFVSQGSVDLKSFEKKTLCGVCAYSTLPSNGVFHVEYSDEFTKFVEKVYPIDFELEPIKCPSEPEPRRACIRDECSSKNSTSAKVVCTDFYGPFELSFNPEKMEYRGAVRGVAKVGAAVIVEPLDFIVYYTPFNAWILVIVIVVIIAVLLFALRKMKKKSVKKEETK